MKSKQSPIRWKDFEKLRATLLRDKRRIREDEQGSRTSRRPRSVAEIARTNLSPTLLCSLYARIISATKARTIIELGTSLGINTLYLAAQEDTTVTTFEGSPAIADVASLTFEFAGAENITLIRGNIDSSLPAYIHSIRRLDFALLDANHRYEPTVRYFEALVTKIRDSSVVVIDDIHRSREMNRAWEHAKNHRLVYGSADLFRCGILFFDPSLNKQHVILQA